ncbi:MAG: DUF3014 domain-containing protein [Methylobacter sp.]|nr:DUF3014 domain-containing protein [Methylobacter sp.]MDP2100310.1 DUF3014 domain-containing protein [Methylobacter sp.]MDP2427112.1 DUF3014 domain-containing protein [Methylobacter sp.]MDP3053667.1 DUF3014 domain-containing protein [Methylobacter sp.]MDP3360914.1 DUF3014 domain-containing protein [Methylobacter sp.]
MSRYDQKTNDKKSSGFMFKALIVLALAGGAWFYLQQQAGVDTGLDMQTLALPSVEKDKAAIDALLLSEALDEQEGASTDDIVELQQEASFVLPVLEHSDALFRDEVTAIAPGLAGWLNTDQLIRKYMLIANDFSQDLRLEKHLRFLKLGQPFAVVQANEKLVIASESYRRYDKLAAAIDALDTQAALDTYKKFRPLLLQVFSEFSYPEEYGLEDIFTKSVAVILAAPVVEGDIAVVKHAVNYKFADPQLESSSPIHKQMLRMGPENTRLIQNKLRQLVEGLVNRKE